MKQKKKWCVGLCVGIFLGFSIESSAVADTLEVTPLSTVERKTTHKKSEDVTENFIEKIGKTARDIGQKEDLYASVMIAQAILESGSGQSELSQAPYFNIFGVKGQYEGKGVLLPTQESDGQGRMYTTKATFCQYDNYEASLNAYAKLIKNGLFHDPTFYQGTWKSEAPDYTAATQFLTGRYATDPHYHEKLDELIINYGLTDYDNVPKNTKETTDYILPLDDPIVTSTYGERGESFHRGIDLAMDEGTKIQAAGEGRVTRSAYHPSWGNYVTILHPDGLTTLYAHCKKNLVQVGQEVQQGEKIALVGNTGNSTGPHLHFEVNRSQSLVQEQLLDPIEVLGE
ncbi:peptidoglycan DD-metalloendopeptidase family protein [Tetragenococcus koreensis]|uniref:peptidoglycan DD-metalloendopeptidase family protein n=1 Tax=Tetragenococcus koreensis TaxID=290335 RepID=UPI001F463717|nr:peptidoglycan DD-metalloendopeptidase family protein [Tetragenococcus koreensis]MCF1613584.1 peptidoglycan DD-metalloendopeptidase family protein [Tetragenococcus koreensis]MCF1623420.1 peptidoglycan DD-metalloendopeptidase family protein [Tetragenococcus koreensis]